MNLVTDDHLNRASRHFRGYGLHFESEVELPWPEVAAEGEPDVSIRLGQVPSALESPTDSLGYWQAASGALLMHVDGIARCLVSNGGQRVVVELAQGDADGFTCLLDSLLATCLQMRGILPLHASAVATAQGAVLFAGRVGTGKSTLAAALIDRGYALLADGIVGIGLDGGGTAVARTGFSRVRLWADAMRMLAPRWQRAAEAPVRPGIESYSVAPDHFRDADLVIHSVYILNHAIDSAEPVIETLAGVRAFTELAERTFRFRFGHAIGRSDAHFRVASAVVGGAREMCILKQPPIKLPPAELAARVAERLPPPCQ